jgi:hypothetical protein
LEARIVRVEVVKLVYLEKRIVQVFRGFPCRFVVACPLNQEQSFAMTGASFKDFFDIQLLLSSNHSGGRRRVCCP